MKQQARLFLFNPGHETAVIQGSKYYTPPANVMRMTEELATLPLWIADDTDYVWVSETTKEQAATLIPVGLLNRASCITTADLEVLAQTGKRLTATPWGISPQSLYLFETLQQQTGIKLDIPVWNPELCRLTGRQTAAACLDYLRQHQQRIEVPESPRFCTSMEEIETCLQTHQPPFIIKTPYSSSGRGILNIGAHTLQVGEYQWISGAIQKQQMVSIEKRLNKETDFALEYYIDEKGNASYAGLSVFESSTKGVYTGNRLAPQSSLELQIMEVLAGSAPDCPELSASCENKTVTASASTLNSTHKPIDTTCWEALKQETGKAVAALFGGYYTGFIGIDMLTYRDEQQHLHIHPCIEINMRYTMGLVAICLQQKYMTPHTFGSFRITYEKKKGETWHKHLAMQEKHPLQLKQGKIEKGYLSLCPVSKETHYHCYLLIE